MPYPDCKTALTALILLTAHLLGIALPSAKAVEINSTCKKNSIRSFNIKGISGFPDMDHCRVIGTELNSDLAAKISKLGAIHNQIANALSTSVDTLFPTGINISLEGSRSGSLGYSHERNTIFLTSFPDGSEFLSESTYTHELGHFIASSLIYPPMVRKLLESPLLSEGYADLLATLITGKPSWPVDLPECFGKALRGSTANKGFGTYQGFFSRNFFAQEFSKCCSSLEINSDPNKNIQKLCTDLTAQMAKNRGTPLDRSPFKAERCFNKSNETFDVSQCDDHQLGIPLNELFVSLGQKLGRGTALNLFFSALKNLKGQTTKSTYSCKLRRSTLLTDRVDIEETRLTPDNLVDSIRGSFTPPEQQEFDIHWNSFGMKKWLELDHIAATYRVQEAACRVFARDEWTLSTVLFPNCEISCVLIRSEPITLKFNIIKNPPGKP